jgi:2-dehydro-3-deoxyphosphooctonate aldolase (KDO 8-P synthase)
VRVVFKASYDKANRTSRTSFRGPASTRLAILATSSADRPADADRHPRAVARRAAAVGRRAADSAFLSRQTDLLVAAARTGKAVNVKKGSSSRRDDMRTRSPRSPRRATIGARDRTRRQLRLQQPRRRHARVSDAARARLPVVFDVTHSLQLPGGGDGVTAGMPSTSNRWHPPASPPVSMRCSWKSTRTVARQERRRQRAALDSLER